MLPFELDITTLFDDNRIAYDFDSSTHQLSSAELRIRFLPNISKTLSQKPHVSGEAVIYLWEDIYLSRKPQVISRFRSLLGLNKRLHGRQTAIMPLDKQSYLAFLDDHHLLGETSAKTRLGLYHKEQLVAVAGFGRPCPIDYQGRTFKSYELIRFCNKTGITVVGGLSKMLEHFIRSNSVEHLMTYVDREWSEGEIYQKLGFQLIETTPPQEFFLSPDDNQRYRLADLQTSGTEYTKWQKLANLGNNKYVKILS